MHRAGVDTMRSQRCRFVASCWGFVVAILSATGAKITPQPSAPTDAVAHPQAVGGMDCIPRELKKIVLPAYVIEPPDVLLIEAIHAVPKQPYHLQPYDTVAIQVGGTPAEAPISGLFPVGPMAQSARTALWQCLCSGQNRQSKQENFFQDSSRPSWSIRKLPSIWPTAQPGRGS